VEISIQKAKELNRMWHSRLPLYETGFCEKARICFGALHGGRWYAVAIWDNPTARALPQGTWLELKRMAICAEAPRNTASRMLKVMASIIRKRFLHIERLISYQSCIRKTLAFQRQPGFNSIDPIIVCSAWMLCGRDCSIKAFLPSDFRAYGII